ncbi:unnamed protein product [Fraxinus pennsylvanica]|uniref:Uncharacterized protein n=1 Tax=Fraxinus pennsylvanica TaxID=56036 RepID=A0AAD1ZIZ1_9LAMI|nr:unnamed protein product [Fraxinus pennsylvanica]
MQIKQNQTRNPHCHLHSRVHKIFFHIIQNANLTNDQKITECPTALAQAPPLPYPAAQEREQPSIRASSVYSEPENENSSSKRTAPRRMREAASPATPGRCEPRTQPRKHLFPRAGAIRLRLVNALRRV